jgi:hypothetical protein
MSRENSTKLGAFALSLLLGVMANGQTAADATVVIVNLDGPAEGFNDPTPATPVGGNKGKTLGEQRRIAFQYAADIWGETLDSNVTIRIQAAFNPLSPGVLGQAGAISVARDFSGVGQHPGAEFPATWYGAALANKRAGVISTRPVTTSMPSSTATSISTLASTTRAGPFRTWWWCCCTNSGTV